MAEEEVIESFKMSTLSRTETPLKQWKTHKGQSIKTGLHGVHTKMPLSCCESHDLSTDNQLDYQICQ